MADQRKKKSANRMTVHCLKCWKPQECLPSHLARACMKDSTPHERAGEIKKAKESSKEWLKSNRTWDYQDLQQILPHDTCRDKLVAVLLERGFFIRNQPADISRTPGPAASGTSAAPSPQSSSQNQELMEAARQHMAEVMIKANEGSYLEDGEKTNFRYWCEAILVLRHCLRPQAVEGILVSHWVNRVRDGDQVLMDIGQELMFKKVPVRLTREEEAYMETYYRCLRPGYVTESACEHLFVSTTGKPIVSVSGDIHRFKKMCQGKVGQQKAQVVPASLTDVPEETSSAESLPTAQSSATTQRYMDFSSFIRSFPVSPDSQPPKKKQWVEAGFPRQRAFLDRWRNIQYRQRTERLLGRFVARKPSAGKVQRVIDSNGWTTNCPKPKEILRLWKPGARTQIQEDKHVLNGVSTQTWRGLAIKDFGGEKGKGVVTTCRFSRGDIVCDYHGELVTAAVGRKRLEETQPGQAGYMFFFGGKCIDAQSERCSCHSDKDTFGRRINHSSKKANLKPAHVVLKVDGRDRDVILLKALKDICVDTELTFDYGVRRKSFRGEGLDLTWLDE
ncbi:uncharacterized protein LOC121653764 isoform X2 [Melanotaenia boesemani]|uniref:uncharacterized protein LOC121653764 isoform X2 n=1 Tax=Melanotaenia boesemani TaxID=1250792 RepID=UPI001C051B62|nr:uncharacterized protein LOC121653764 isoform X2 [Melanotaenia boesemani]